MKVFLLLLLSLLSGRQSQLQLYTELAVGDFRKTSELNKRSEGTDAELSKLDKMPPKKQKAKSSGGQGESSSSKGAKASSSSSNSRASRGAAQVNLSSANEVRLRRLLQNTGGLNPPAPLVQESLTEGQRKQAGKRLKNIYDSLVAEGFTSNQIEAALATLPLV